jgi:hypothetical protein
VAHIWFVPHQLTIKFSSSLGTTMEPRPWKTLSVTCLSGRSSGMASGLGQQRCCMAHTAQIPGTEQRAQIGLTSILEQVTLCRLASRCSVWVRRFQTDCYEQEQHAQHHILPLHYQFFSAPILATMPELKFTVATLMVTTRPPSTSLHLVVLPLDGMRVLTDSSLGFTQKTLP